MTADPFRDESTRRAIAAYLVAQHALRAACDRNDSTKAEVLTSALVTLWARLPRELRSRAYLLGAMQWGGPRW